MRVNVYLTAKFHEKLKNKSRKLEMNVSQYIRYVLVKFWEQED